MIGLLPLGADDQAETLYLGSLVERYSRTGTPLRPQVEAATASTAERILSAFSNPVIGHACATIDEPRAVSLGTEYNCPSTIANALSSAGPVS